MLWQMPVSVSVSMSGYRRCQNTVWHQKKGLPSPTTLAFCPFPSSRCQFQSASPLWICEDILSRWMADWQINIPMSLPTELQRRLTWSMQSKCWRQNYTKMGFGKGQISTELERGATWLALIDIIMLWLCRHSFQTVGCKKVIFLTWYESEELSGGHHVFNSWL